MTKLTIGDISSKSIKHESPSQRIRQRFRELIEFEMLVPHSLLIASDSLYGLPFLLLGQEPGVELVVWHQPQK